MRARQLAKACQCSADMQCRPPRLRDRKHGMINPYMGGRSPRVYTHQVDSLALRPSQPRRRANRRSCRHGRRRRQAGKVTSTSTWVSTFRFCTDQASKSRKRPNRLEAGERGRNKPEPKRNPQTCWKPHPGCFTHAGEAPYTGASSHVIAPVPASPLNNGFGELKRCLSTGTHLRSRTGRAVGSYAAHVLHV